MINPSIYPPPQINTTQSITPLPPELLMRTLSRLCPTKTHTYTHTLTHHLTSPLLFSSLHNTPIHSTNPPSSPSLSPSLSIHHSTHCTAAPTHLPTHPAPISISISTPQTTKNSYLPTTQELYAESLSRERERERSRWGEDSGTPNPSAGLRARSGRVLLFLLCVFYFSRDLFSVPLPHCETHTRGGKFARVLKKPCRRRCTL